MTDWEIEQYADLIYRILNEGEKRSTRNGKTYSLFGEVLKIDMVRSFPLLRGRKIYYKGVLGELAAFFRGPKTIKDFKLMGCNYWDDWGDKDGNINVDYGNAWINFNGVNQMEELITKLKTNPTDRRLIISGWRPDKLDTLSLPCCHLLYQWYVRDGKFLDMVWYQRSVDVMVGLPSDIVLAAAWNALLANECGYTPGLLTFVMGDTHIYSNHTEPTLEYLRQLKNQPKCILPYSIAKDATVFNFEPGHLVIDNYDPLSYAPPISFKLNV